jgi:hypothetical protein
MGTTAGVVVVARKNYPFRELDPVFQPTVTTQHCTLLFWHTRMRLSQRADVDVVLSCDAVWTCRQIPMFRTEAGDSRLFQNLCTYLQVYTQSQSRTTLSNLLLIYYNLLLELWPLKDCIEHGNCVARNEVWQDQYEWWTGRELTGSCSNRTPSVTDVILNFRPRSVRNIWCCPG